ncbi:MULTISPECIES: ArdC family protein [unclassified Enterococcus]|uniref:ArdC family protein n=1 Tax=unclassified Enterococcus TaxID=2608891 RepID=UPI001CE0E7A3|nr:MULTISPECIES: ArdC family protein [unclassified Enterococcus]MCA5014566.1 hypothetical protein [Enterococcus sp. S23]MCA5017819.1 hypothetical protein [Enterococcus sp. S22(2020)]
MLEKSFVQEKKTPNPSVEEIIKKKDYKELSKHLEEGIKEYLNGDTFKNFLDFVSKFHKYSSKNVRLILDQNPNATHVAGFKSWKKMGRYVNKGSKALYVYAPSIKDKVDKDGNKVTNENGEIEKEISYFLTPVFDVSQTSGEQELPKQVYNLTEDMDDPKVFTQTYKALVEISPAPVTIESFDDSAEGYYRPSTNDIVIQEGLGEVMTLKVLLHEMTHAMLHSNSEAQYGDQVYSKQEFEAESVAYIVSSHLGIDTSDYSFGYLASWTEQGRKLEELSNSLEVITSQAKELIDRIDQSLNKVYTMDAPKNKFEERVAIARTKGPVEPRKPAKEYEVADPKVNRPTKTL